MTEQRRDRFIYNGEVYYLGGLEHYLKYPIEGINSIAEESVNFNEIEDKIFDLLNERLVFLDLKGLITPQDYGMKPNSVSTAC